MLLMSPPMSAPLRGTLAERGRPQGDSAVESGCAVELFAQDVELPGVTGSLLDHVYVDPAQRNGAEVTMRYRVVERIPCCNSAGLLALRLIFGHQGWQGLLGEELELPGAFVQTTVVVALFLQ